MSGDINPNTECDEVNGILNTAVEENDSNEDIQENDDTQQHLDNYINEINGKVLLDSLAPQIVENEQKKRIHKDRLIKIVTIFLGTQLGIIALFISAIIASIIVFHGMHNDYTPQLLKMIFAFFGTYITSVIVELIFMLRYIVSSVFDTSIAGLMEVFHPKDKHDKE